MSNGPQFRFNRLTGVKCYFLKVFVLGDFFILAIALMVLANMLKSFMSFLAFLFIYTLYLLLFRLNKPMGYDVHKFKTLVKPRTYRPGRIAVNINFNYEAPTKK
jgi:hypothetical protein